MNTCIRNLKLSTARNWCNQKGGLIDSTGVKNFKHAGFKRVQVGKDQEKAQSEKDSHSKIRGGKKTKLTIRYLYHETYRKPNEQLFSQKVATQFP